MRWPLGTGPSCVQILPGCSQEDKDAATAGPSWTGTAASSGRGALHVLSLYAGRTGRFRFFIVAETVGVHISLTPVPLGCRVDGMFLFGAKMGNLASLTTHRALRQ